MAENENKVVAENEVEQKPAKVKAAKEKKKENKPGFFAKLKQKFKNLKSEFKKITWASKKSTFKSFGLVIVSVVAIALVIGLVDTGLVSLFNLLASKINF